MTPASSRFLNRRTPPHLATLILMAGLSAMTMNIFLPSLPAIADWYGTSYGTAQLSVSLYLGLSGALQLVIGPMADRYGRRPVTLVACVVFLLATIGCLFAPTIEVFLVFRMIQAAVATGMVLSRAIVRDMVPEAQAASMIGYVTMGMAIVPMFAPAIGGWVDETFGWKANFALLLVLGTLISALIWADLGETSERRQTSLADQIRSYPALLTSWRFWGYSITAAAGSGTFFSFLGGAPAVATQVFGMTPAELGIYFAAPGIGYMLGNFLSARLAMRLGTVRMVFWGTIMLTLPLIVMLVLGLTDRLSPLAFFALMSCVGVGNGMSLPSANAGMMSVRPDLIGSASGLGGALMIGGGAALSALAAVVMGKGESALPLIVLMASSAGVAVISTLVVIARNRRLGL
ncbi:multidrug effflux MFS transporter [Gemmobacter nectariphilus]|uniref:multidrug effflux MFS transporter n=1 Tax=Gemmobacter nectariphilus TaxID=220343 RepID=UPI00042168F2|nr:multidrug effflux MFS transporter [Gemmobacter nectariphilus]